jgi:high-affinity iron transporter
VIPTFVIFLREGIEASMIVAILLAYLSRIGQRDHFREVYLGVGSALVAVTGGGFGAYFLMTRYSGSRTQTILETCTYLVAAVALTYMTFWMQGHSRSLGADLERRSEQAISSGSRWSLGILGFQAVVREGLETMVFTLAIVFSSSSQAPTNGQSRVLIIGAVAGLVTALAIAVSIYRLGRRINLGRFFRILGVTLMIFAAGLLADAVQNMQELSWLPFGRQVLWNTKNILSEDSALGDVLHSFVGYADRPTVLQAVVWILYLCVSVAWFMRRNKKATKKPVAA